MQEVIVYRSPIEAIFWDFFLNSGLALPFMLAIFAFLVTIATLNNFLSSPKLRMNKIARYIRNSGIAMCLLSLILPAIIIFAMV